MARVQHTPSPLVVFTRSQARSLDRAAAEELGLPGILLMENAAIALAEVCRGLIAARSLRRVLVCCGPGNNAGDGLALARHLHNRGVGLGVLLTAPRDRCGPDAATNLRIVERMGLALSDLNPASPSAALRGLGPGPREVSHLLLVDALLGTGLDRPVNAPLDAVINWMNELRDRGATTLAVDIPTGLDCDTGEPLGPAVIRADLTLTLAGHKAGLLLPRARPFTGELLVGDIGVPPELLRRFGTPAPAGTPSTAAPGGASDTRGSRGPAR